MILRSVESRRPERALEAATRERVPRWVWIAISLALSVLSLMAALVLLRHMGLRRVASVQAEVARKGGVATLGEFLGSIGVDADLQEAYWTWSLRVSDVGPFFTDCDADAQAWLESGPGSPFPSSVSATLRKHEALISRGLALLRRPRLKISSLGYAPLDLTADSTIRDVTAMRVPSLLTLRNLATWLSFRALESDDADPWLRELDRLITAQVPPGLIIDAMILQDQASIRDEAYFNCLIHGKLSDRQLEAWLSESPPQLQRLRSAVKGERVMLWARPFEADVAVSLTATGERTLWQDCQDTALVVWSWSALPHDRALAFETLYNLERRLGGDRTVTLEGLEDISAQPWTPFFGDWLLSPLSLSGVAIEGACRHRAWRCAARVVRLALNGEPLPLTPEAFAARWPGLLDAGLDLPRLSYRHRNDDQFRIAVDPSQFLSDLTSAEEIAGMPSIDEPVLLSGLCTQRPAGLEFRLPLWILDRIDADDRPTGVSRR